MAEASQEPKEKEKEKAPGGTSLVVVALLVLNTLLSGGGLALAWLRGGELGSAPGGSPDAEPSSPAASADGGAAAASDGGKPEAGELVQVESMTLQLRNPEVARYVRLSVQLEVPTADDANTVKQKMALLRDGFISFLSDRSYEDLRGSGGLERAKAGLIEAARKAVGKERVRGLYITDFVVQ